MSFQSGFQMRDAVFAALVKTYAPKDETDWWLAKRKQRDGKTSYSADVCISLTTDLFAMLVFHTFSDDKRSEYYRGVLDLEVQRMIWNNFDGGTTAAAVAREVCDIMNIPHPNLDKGTF